MTRLDRLGSMKKKKRVAGKKRRASKTSRAPKRKRRAGAKKKLVRRRKQARQGEQERTFPVAFDDASRSSSGGQAGDTQGLSPQEEYDSESVRELVEEGQYLEAEAVSGVEDARDPDQEEVTSREVPEDDVPEEYKDRD
jgi:hypothetical protein